MSIAEIRAGLAKNLGQLRSIRVVPEMPDSPNPPQAVINLQTVQYDGAFAKGLTTYNFQVLLIVGRASERTAQRTLDAFITPGVGSIKDAIESDRSLNGSAYDVRVEIMSNYGSILIADQNYLAAEFTVVVYGN